MPALRPEQGLRHAVEWGLLMSEPQKHRPGCLCAGGNSQPYCAWCLGMTEEPTMEGAMRRAGESPAGETAEDGSAVSSPLIEIAEPPTPC